MSNSISLATVNTLSSGNNPFEFYGDQNKDFNRVLSSIRNPYLRNEGGSIPTTLKNCVLFTLVGGMCLLPWNIVAVVVAGVATSCFAAKIIWQQKEPSFKDIFTLERQEKLLDFLSKMGSNETDQKALKNISTFIKKVEDQNFHKLSADLLKMKNPVDKLLRDAVGNQECDDWRSVTTSEDLGEEPNFDTLLEQCLTSLDQDKTLDVLNRKLDQKSIEKFERSIPSDLKHLFSLLKTKQGMVFSYLTFFTLRNLYCLSSSQQSLEACNRYKKQYREGPLGDMTLKVETMQRKILKHDPDFIALQEPPKELVDKIKNKGYGAVTSDGKNDTYVFFNSENWEKKSDLQVPPEVRMSAVHCASKTNHKFRHVIVLSMHASADTRKPNSAENQLKALEKIQKDFYSKHHIEPVIIFGQDSNTTSIKENNKLTSDDYKEIAEKKGYQLISPFESSVLKMRTLEPQTQIRKGEKVDMAKKDVIFIKLPDGLKLDDVQKEISPRLHKRSNIFLLKFPALNSWIAHFIPKKWLPNFLPMNDHPTDHAIVYSRVTSRDFESIR